MFGESVRGKGVGIPDMCRVGFQPTIIARGVGIGMVGLNPTLQVALRHLFQPSGQAQFQIRHGEIMRQEG
jgi:hypothetical protein